MPEDVESGVALKSLLSYVIPDLHQLTLLRAAIPRRGFTGWPALRQLSGLQRLNLVVQSKCEGFPFPMCPSREALQAFIEDAGKVVPAGVGLNYAIERTGYVIPFFQNMLVVGTPVAWAAHLGELELVQTLFGKYHSSFPTEMVLEVFRAACKAERVPVIEWLLEAATPRFLLCHASELRFQIKRAPQAVFCFLFDRFFEPMISRGDFQSLFWNEEAPSASVCSGPLAWRLRWIRQRKERLGILGEI